MEESLPANPVAASSELERDPCYQDALRLRASYLQVPWYAEQDREHGMLFWVL